ncbi:TPA: hypothetical protein EYP75_04655 [Candidatus Bathyarchaeota archaeon]|nr:hypothetical protein [Candidatus Bathyarchaeota archaeon]
MSEGSNKIRSMTDLLRSGATLTSLSCPVCSSPLFRMKNGDLWCGQCQKKVIVVREGREFDEAQSITALSTVEQTLLEKMMEINEKIRGTNDSDELQKLSMLLSSLLENLRRIRSFRKG